MISEFRIIIIVSKILAIRIKKLLSIKEQTKKIKGSCIRITNYIFNAFYISFTITFNSIVFTLI
jgi:hypothetical protein